MAGIKVGVAMSLKHYKYVWRNYKKNGGHKLVLLALADYADENTDECWPSIATLAEMTCVSDRQVQNILSDLRKSGDIEIAFARGRTNTNTYKIIIKGEVDCTISPKEKVNSGTKIDQKGEVDCTFNDNEMVQSSTEKVNSGAEKVKPTSPDPLITNNNNSNELLRTANADAPTLDSVGKKQKGKKAKTGENKEQLESPEQHQWFSAMCWLVNGHQDYKLLSQVDRCAIGQTVKAILNSGEHYTIDDLRTWYTGIWSKTWPGLQRNGVIQKPRLKDIKTGIGQVKTLSRSPPVALNGHSGMSAFAQDFQGSEA